MGIFRTGLVVCAAWAATVVLAQAQSYPSNTRAIQPEAWQIVELTNQARTAAGAGPLKWDPALTEAARRHCLRMAAEGPIAHRYNDEPSLSQRAAAAGAHFSLIEENVAVGPDPATIENEWMNSPGHRTNLLNPAVDRIGVAVVASRGTLYAVADYDRAVPLLTPAQVEAKVASLVRVSGVTILRDPTYARAVCAMNRGYPSSKSGLEPAFIMRWQDADLTRLPQLLAEKLASGEYREAAIGSCPPQGDQGAFTAYRVAAVLY